jgi:hypothetical protein
MEQPVESLRGYVVKTRTSKIVERVGGVVFLIALGFRFFNTGLPWDDPRRWAGRLDHPKATWNTLFVLAGIAAYLGARYVWPRIRRWSQ